MQSCVVTLLIIRALRGPSASTVVRARQPRRKVGIFRFVTCKDWELQGLTLFMQVVQGMPQERHPTLYFDDGDIVLSATTSGTGIKQLFRVHRLYLSHASDVFRDMFVIATSSVDTEKYDGISLLPLPHDSAQDLESLLDIIYHPTYVLTACTLFHSSHYSFIVTGTSLDDSHRTQKPIRRFCSLALHASRRNT